MAPRMTLQTQLVLRLLLDAPDHEMYGLKVIQESALPPGTVYPLMQRLEQAGWVESRWEEGEPAERHGRPPRRYYRLTREGATRARNALELASRKRTPTLARLLGLEQGATTQEDGR